MPGNIDAPMSQGPNLLIQQGAKLVTCGGDILVEYRDRFPVKLAACPTWEEELHRQRLEGILVPREEKEAPEEAPAPQDGRELVPLAQQRERFTDDELAILGALGDKKCSADELVELTQIPVRRVTSALTMLQVRSAVEEGPGRRFAALVRLEE